MKELAEAGVRARRQVRDPASCHRSQPGEAAHRAGTCSTRTSSASTAKGPRRDPPALLPQRPPHGGRSFGFSRPGVPHRGAALELPRSVYESGASSQGAAAAVNLPTRDARVWLSERKGRVTRPRAGTREKVRRSRWDGDARQSFEEKAGRREPARGPDAPPVPAAFARLPRRIECSTSPPSRGSSPVGSQCC